LKLCTENIIRSKTTCIDGGLGIAYSTPRKGSSEKEFGIDPVKLLYDRSLNKQQYDL
jgi:hypothetical protein